MSYDIINGNNLDLLAQVEDNSIDAIVTDPPYGLAKIKAKTVKEAIAAWLKDEEYHAKGVGFMGRSWDAFVPSPLLWKECLRVLKPGGHLAVFAGSRTLDLMGLSLRLAGAEVRDTLEVLGYHYGSGFPKSLDISKAIDADKGLTREVIGQGPNASRRPNGTTFHPYDECNAISGDPITKPACDLSTQWQGWGTALKPSYEPIILCRKEPEGTIAQNVEQYGTGGLNIDGCRLATSDKITAGKGRTDLVFDDKGSCDFIQNDLGRWPPNTLLLHHPLCTEKACDLLCVTRQLQDKAKFFPQFFYGSKASRAEREKGCENLPDVKRSDGRETEIENPRLRTTPRKNHHPTVKPLDLMRWLCRLVTPPNGIILDPFSGSGSTIIAAHQEGFQGLGFELNNDYVQIALARCAATGE